METAIICVDDEKSILSGLEQQIFREFNSQFIVELAQSGEEAIGIINELIENNVAIPLIITDQMMPGLKGNELVSIISEKLPETKCIMLSGYVNSDDLKGAINKNLISCMAKPWKHEELMNLIRQNVIN
jgi:YesN/AraC family two-component response regulator